MGKKSFGNQSFSMLICQHNHDLLPTAVILFI